ncbi:hypothetical protein F5884DRAFT_344288 [Xylogone sp. PMI_703]|nr:hypothetical protein F5884DRAFT_344288 [Xylogone sp. PMI_703]
MVQFKRESTGAEVVAAFPESVKDKTIVITGPSKGGIGAETAISLARGNPKHLILAGRSLDRISPVIEDIKRINSDIEITYIEVDLGSLSSVRRAAEAINKTTDKIDILINNAAIMACPYAKTEDGYESQFATNHLGHFLLTALLKEKLLAAEGARVVNLTSNAGFHGGFDFKDVNFDDGKTFHPIAGYHQAKYANILFTVGLSKRFESTKLAAFAVHPGSIVTELQKHFRDPAVFKDIVEYVERMTGGSVKLEEKKTLQQGCSTTLVAALDPSITDKSGSVLADAAIKTDLVKPEALTSELVDTLWELSEKLVGQKFSA